MPRSAPRFVRRAPILAVAVLSILAMAAGLPAWPSAPENGPVWPDPPAPARVRYLTTIAEPKDVGAGTGWLARTAAAIIGRQRQPRMLRPRAVVTDHTGRLLVADPEQQMVHVLDVGRRKYGRLDPAPFASPVGIAVGRDDTIYVTDSIRRRVFVYAPVGSLRATLGVVNGEPIFARPTGIAVGPDGNLYVVDTTACCIRVLSPHGRVLRTIGRRGQGDGEFNYPTDLAVGATGHLYVVDALNARLQELDGDGAFVREIGHRGNGTGDLDKPKGVALDSEGHIYIAEGLHDVVQVFNERGQLLLVFGQTGSRAGEFSLPSGMHIDAANRIYVADALNGRVQVFQYVSQPDAR
jgi:DNA-binding beta-propeller fold protein YncE